MATELAFDGLACLPSNVALIAALDPYTIEVPLSATPGTTVTVQLDAFVRLIKLYSPDMSVRYLIDGLPQPPAQGSGTSIAWATVLLGHGDTLLPGKETFAEVPNTFAAHTVTFLSRGDSLTVTLTAYMERT